MQEKSRQTLLPGLKLFYEHPPYEGGGPRSGRGSLSAAAGTALSVTAFAVTALPEGEPRLSKKGFAFFDSLEYCMYFWFFKRKKWGKKAAETGRRNCVVLPQIIGRYPQNGNIFTFHCAPVLHVSGRSTGSRVVKTFFQKRG